MSDGFEKAIYGWNKRYGGKAEDDEQPAQARIEELEAQLAKVEAAIPVAYQMALERAVKPCEYVRETCGIDQDGNSYADEPEILFASSCLVDAIFLIRALTPPADLVEQATAKVKENENE